MYTEDILTVATTRGELSYTINEEGFIQMKNPQTISRYYQLRWKEQPDLDELGIFFAFSKEQYARGVEGLKKRGFIQEESELRQGTAGAIGSAQSLSKMYEAYREIDRKIVAECDPQEVYFWEFNNHETPYGWDGDLEIMKIIVGLWGFETAVGLKRYCKVNDKELEKLR